MPNTNPETAPTPSPKVGVEGKQPCKGMFDVHAFVLVRVKVEGVKANSHREAASLVSQQLPIADIFPETNIGHFDRLPCGGQPAYTEHAGEIKAFLVDVVGDEDFEQSRWVKENEV